LDYYIHYGNTSIFPSLTPELANAAFPAGNVFANCPGGITCWEYVIQQSIANGISPAFSITIWWEEGGFGGAGANSEFGCFPGGITSQQLDFHESFDFFGVTRGKRLVFAAFILSLLSVELSWVVMFLPLGFINAAAFLALFFLLVRDGIVIHFQGYLSLPFVFKQLTFFIVLAVLIFASARWAI